METVVTVLFQIPNQPITFYSSIDSGGASVQGLNLNSPFSGAVTGFGPNPGTQGAPSPFLAADYGAPANNTSPQFSLTA